MLKNFFSSLGRLFRRKTRKTAIERRREFLNQFRKGQIEGLEDRSLMAAVNFTGTPYVQDFNTLVTSGTSQAWTNDSTLPAWSLFNKTPAAIATINATDGSSNTGAFVSFGTGTATERALGGVASGGAYFGSPATGAVAGWMAVAIQNNTGATVDTATVGFTGEQWRNGGNATAQTMKAEYGFGATFTGVTTWTPTPASFDFVSKVNTATASALDGNAAANRTTGLGGNLTTLGWTNGSTLWIRWVENNDAGNDHGLGLDDFSFSVPVAAPEINVTGNGVGIASGDTTPSASDNTSFGSATQGGAAIDRVFTIENLGNQNLTLGGSPLVAISGGSNFSILTQPVSGTIAAAGSTTFTVRFNPAAVGAQTATISIANNDSNENPYTFDISGTVTTVAVPEVDVQGNGVSIADGDTTPSATDNTLFPDTAIGSTATRTFTILNTGSAPLNLTGGSFTSTNATFVIQNAPTGAIAPGASATFDVVFTAASGTLTSTISFLSNDADEATYNFDVSGTGLSVGGQFVPYATPGSTTSQNFDTLTGTAWTNGTTLTGWSLFNKDSAPITSIAIGAGASSTGSFYSFGAASAADRALGGVASGGAYFGSPASGAVAGYMAVAVQNTTGGVLGSFTTSYVGEQWRDAIITPQTMRAEYGFGPTFAGVTTWNATPPSFDFTSPTNANSGALDGNLAANRVAGLGGTISGLNWASNDVLWIRWIENNDAGNDQGLAIDDLQFSATAANVNGSLGFGATSYYIDENAGTATITVNRVSGALGAISVDYATVAGGTAVAGTDYTTTSGTLNWADNDNAPKQFTIPITNNIVLGGSKTISLALTNPTGGATLSPTATSTVTIRDDEKADLLLNELSVNPPSTTDAPYEYIELRGTPNSTLADWYVVQLAANPSGTAGNVLVVTNLSSSTVGSNGLLVITATGGAGHTIPSGTSVVTNAALDVGGIGLSNQSQSMLLIYSASPITVGQDFDTNNDGTLDLPGGATVIDAVAWVNPAFGSDLVYGGVALIQGSDFADAASRISTDNTPLSASAWFNGNLVDDGVSTPNSEKAYNQTGGSANLPAGATLTPGAPNVIATTGLSIAADLASQVEGNSGSTVFTFTITRSGDVSGTTNVNWAVTGSGTAPADAADFTGGVLPSGVANFLANETSKQISVSVNGDVTIEPNEQFTVTLSNPTGGATLVSAAAAATITSDDLQVLAAGDIVITAVDSDDSDEFTFVPLVNLAPFTEIRFTDNGWLAAGGFRTGEGTLLYRAPAGGIAAGTEIGISGNAAGTSFTFTSPTANQGTATIETGAIQLAVGGDSLIAFQGTLLVPTPIYAITLSRNAFDADATSTTTSALPSALTVGTSAVAIGGASSAVRNGQYNNVVTSGTAAQLQTAVSNSANWTTSSTRITLDYVNFVLDSGVNIAPTVNDQSFSVAESASLGTTVGTVVASDSNVGQSLAYAFMVSGSPAQISGPFTISATTGQITVTGVLDFETTANYPLTVRVTDNGSPALNSTATVTINVTDRSEGRVFIPTTLTATAGTPVVVPVNLQVTEVDGAAIGGALIHIVYDSSKLTFGSANLSSGPLAGFAFDSSGSTPGNLIFTATGTPGATINSGTTVTLANVTFNVAAAASGTVTLNLQSDSSIADNSAALFKFSPAVTNGADANVDGLVTIGVGNAPPTVTSGASATVAENIATTAYTITATDPNPGTVLIYSISGTDSALFSVDGSSGAVSFIAPPNFESPSDAGGNNVYDLTVIASDGTLTDSKAITITVTNVIETLHVSSLVSTASGFVAVFSQAFAAADLNLYGNAALGVADVTLTGALTGAIRGSLILNAAGTQVTFLRTQSGTTAASATSVLPNDTYTVTFRSAANGFHLASGALLDGDANEVAGGDYTSTFVVNNPANAVRVGLPDFARGHGQSVDVPNNGTGLPLYISTGQNVSSLQLTLNYDPALLNITAFTLNPTLSGAGVQATPNFNTPGVVILDITSTTQLSAAAGALTLGSFTATVPATATYGAKQVLDITSLTVFDNDPGIPQERLSIGDDAVQVSAYFGDTSGNRQIQSNDGTLIARVNALLDTGFTAYQMADPVIIADFSGNNQLQSNDGTLLARYNALISTPQIPTVPTAPSPLPGLAIDPILAIGSISGSAGNAVNVPLTLTVPASESTIGGVTSYLVRISYDNTKLSFNTAGGLSIAGTAVQGFTATVGTVVNGSTTTISLNVDGGATGVTAPINPGSTIVLGNLTFSILAGATGAANLNILGTFQGADTAVFDDGFGNLALLDSHGNPAPTNGVDPDNDGVITIAGVNLAPTAVSVTPNPGSLAENTAVPTNLLVGTIAVTDDGQGTNTLSLAGADASFFTLSGNQLLLVAGTNLNFEAKPSYSVTVRVDDPTVGGTPDATTTFTLNLTNVNEAPTLAPQTFSIPENSANSTVVGTVLANDVDAGDTKSFAITAGNSSGVFAINASTGQITVANGSLLNFEGTASYPLTVSVTDSGSLSASNTVTINLTNVLEPTTFANQTFSLPENTANGITVGTATAVPDTGVTITGYAITAGNGTGVGAFSINSSGVIQVNDGSQLNFEVTPTFTLTVSATDSTSAVTTATVTVNLTNINEQPIQTLNRTITVNPGQVIQLSSALLSFADPENAALTYTITGAPARGTLTKNGAAITSFTSTDLNASSSVGNAIRYTGTTGTAGQTDSFTVTVSDGANTITGVVVNLNFVAPVGPASFTGVYTQSFDNLLPTPVPADRLTLPSAMVLPAGWSVLEYGGTFGTVGGNAEQSIQVDSGTSTTGDTFLYGNPGSNERALGTFSSGSLQAYLGLAIVNNSGAALSNFTLSFTGEQWKDGVHASAVNKLTFDYSTTAASLGATIGFTSVTALDFTAPVAAAVTGADVVLDGNLAANRTAVSATVTGVSWAPGATLFLRWKDLNDAGNDDMLAIDNVTLSTNSSPTIANQAFSLAENSATGAAVGTVVASDADVGQTLSYAITGGNASGAFAINASTGAITVADGSQLNFEATPSFPLTVTVTDSGTPNAASSATVTVTLTNVDEAPTFGAASYNFSLAENSATASAVGSVGATDPDAGATLVYSLSGTGANNFAINPSTGAITVASGAVLNFEGTNSFSLTASVTDGTHPVSVPVTISLTNVNEAPTFAPQNFSVSEQAAIGATVGTVVASDVDAGDTKSFSITAGNTGNAFAISAGGVITVAAALDFNITPVYTLTVSVTDGGSLLASNTVTISVTNVNSAPTIAPQTFSVPENSANGTTIGSVLATDVDAGDVLAFAITGGNASGAFALSPSGVLSVANGSLLNFEGTSSYSLTVSVTDNGSPVGSSNATITVNLTNVNEAPTIAPQSFSVAENSANGSTVRTVVASDVDAGDSKAFAITAGNTGNVFAISPSGVITVANGSLLNFEGLSSYPLTVSVTDGGSLSASNTVTVNLSNVNEAPTIAPQTFSVAENSANGTAVGTVVANDVDAGDSKSFAITAGNSSGAFAINPSTGAITVANGSLLNFEGTPSYSLTVSVTDGGSLSASTTVTINLTNVNEAPAITSGNAFSIAENTAAVTTVTGLDPDSLATLAYSIVGGVDAGKFTIDHDLGLLSFLSAPNFESPGDIGGNNVYDLIVRVSDGALSGDKGIAVTVTNVNEAPTIANQSFSVLDTVATGFTVGTVVANDVDASDSKTFAITAGNTGNAFAISPSGVITVANTLNSAVTPSYSLTVSVTDAGTLSASATVTITVNHLNSNPTNIGLSNATIAENAGANAVVGLLSTTDPDLPSDTHTYTLMTTGTGSTDFASFNISGNQLRANASFDFEAKPSYTIRVKSTDQGGSSVEKVFTIFVTDVIETGNQAPTNIALSSAIVAPLAPTGTVVGNLTTTDPNSGNTFSYSLGGVNAAKFMIAGSMLRMASPVADPVGTVYNITVTSTDQGGLSFTKAFTITVGTAANVAPTFINLSATSIAENNLPNAFVSFLTTVDANAGNTFTYELVSGTGSTDNSAFSIPAGTNELRANSSFDYEAKTTYQIRIRSTDQGGLSTERAATIYIANVVETGNQAPTNISLSGLTVRPAAPAATVVGNLTTTDPNPGNTFTYTLSGPDAGKFVINSYVLQVAPAAVIGPVGTTYTISVTSTDQGNASLTKTFTITVANPVNVAPTALVLSNSTIAENAGANALIGSFTTTDPNSSDAHTYTLVAGLGGDDNALFTIVGNQLFAVNSFDYETKTSYKIRVRTTDQDGLFYDKAITVFISNIVGA